MLILVNSHIIPVNENKKTSSPSPIITSLVLQSPNGTKYSITIENGGSMSVTPIGSGTARNFILTAPNGNNFITTIDNNGYLSTDPTLTIGVNYIIFQSPDTLLHNVLVDNSGDLQVT